MLHNLCLILQFSTKCRSFHDFVFFCSNTLFINRAWKFKYKKLTGVKQLFGIDMWFLFMYHLISQEIVGQNSCSAHYVGTFCVTAGI